MIGAGYDPYRKLLMNTEKIITSDIDPTLKNIDILCDADSIPLPDASIDSIVSIEVFEHIKDLDRCLEECVRLLKPNGILYFTMPVMFHIHADPVDYRRLTKDGAEALVPEAFVIQSMRYYGSLLNVVCDLISSASLGTRVLRPFFRVATVFSRTSEVFPSGLSVVARKK